MILIKKCKIYSPDFLGIKDVLVAGGKIISIKDEIKPISDVDIKIIDADEMILFPGFIDGHVHIAGAGGEGGPATRTPEIQLGDLLKGGITTVVGCLGTDGITRNVESVLMKAKGLRKDGVTAFVNTGAYQVPTPTILGDVAKDIAIIEEIIGVGEIAISDHRSSHPTVDELIHLTEHARVGGMLGGKAGIVNLHMGDAKNPFDIIYKAVQKSELSFKQFLPTHCNRNDYIFEDAKKYGKNGYIDITASSYPYFPEYEVKPSKAIKELVESGVPIEHITMTSDGGGSLPDFDENGNLIKLVSGPPASIYKETIDLIKNEKMPVEKAILPVTKNPAKILKLENKGEIKEEFDADLLLINNDYQISYMIAKGKIMIDDGKIVKKGFFE